MHNDDFVVEVELNHLDDLRDHQGSDEKAERRMASIAFSRGFVGMRPFDVPYEIWLNPGSFKLVTRVVPRQDYRNRSI